MHDLAPLLERVWPVLAFLALVAVLADLADEAGLFDVAARRVAAAAGGSTRLLFVLFCVLATGVTWLLSLDTTAVLLAPVAVSLAASLGVAVRPFAYASVWLASTASLLLPVSNLTNLLALRRLGGTAGDYLALSWRPQLAVLAVVMTVLLWRHRAALRGRYVVPAATTLPHDPLLVGVAAAAVLGLAPAVLLGAPPWAATGGCLAVLVLAFAGTLLVTLGLLGERLEPWLAGHLTTLPAVAVAGVVLANLVNNLPAYLLLEPAAATSDQGLVVLLVATNVGPLLLLWGALATLLWSRACRRRGLRIGGREFLREGLLVVPPAVLAGVLVVMLG